MSGFIYQGGKVYQGTSKIQPKIFTCGKAARYVFSSTDWVWSGLEFDILESSIKFVPDPENGGCFGDYSSVKPNAGTSLYEIDPAGGTGEFSICSRDLCYWHKFAPYLAISMYSQKSVDTAPKFSFLSISDNNGRIGKFSNPISSINELGSNSKQLFTNTYFETCDELKQNSTYFPSISNKNDFTIKYSIGSNETGNTINTEFYLLGFTNEKNNLEYFSNEIEFLPGVHFVVNKQYKRENTIPFTGLTNKRVLLPGLHDYKDKLYLFTLRQNSTTSFYSHIVFIDPSYTSWNEMPSSSDIIDSYNVSSDTISKDILIYVEFGASVDGGKTIFWNGQEETNELGKRLRDAKISTIVPNNIIKYISLSQSDYTTFINTSGKSVSRYYISSSTVYGEKAWKYVKINVNSSVANTSENNPPEQRNQKYSCINFENILTNTTATSSEDPNINASTKKYNKGDSPINGRYLAKYNKDSQSGVKFQIGVATTTEDWKTTISVKLNYTTNKVKYVGSTNGK